MLSLKKRRKRRKHSIVFKEKFKHSKMRKSQAKTKWRMMKKKTEKRRAIVRSEEETKLFSKRRARLLGLMGEKSVLNTSKRRKKRILIEETQEEQLEEGADQREGMIIIGTRKDRHQGLIVEVIGEGITIEEAEGDLTQEIEDDEEFHKMLINSIEEIK